MPAQRNQTLHVFELLRENQRLARIRYSSEVSSTTLEQLRHLTEAFAVSLKVGDVLFLDGRWYVTHTGLLRLARRKRCRGISVEAVDALCEPTAGRYVLKATVHPYRSSSGFDGYGDADPSNVAPLVRGAEMRVAETRAVNRALRKAYGVGICSVEELGAHGTVSEGSAEARKYPQSSNGNCWATGPRVRDRLCQLIRQHQLDGELVKAYAIDFCGVKSLREATRAQVENFVGHLADWAERDRNALLCQLNSFFRVKEGQQQKVDGAA